MVRKLLPDFLSRNKSTKESFMITIPDPCGEKWAGMKKVDDCHRHCAACDRVLTDFSVMSDDELIIFFKQNNGKVCGRFRKDQLNRPLTKLPTKTSKATWWKAAALLPLTLFPKSGNAQQLQTDSAKTEQLPYMALPDDSVVVDWGHTKIDTTIQWNWYDTEERPWPWGYEVTGGVPLILDVVTFPCTLSVSEICFVSPTTAAESLLGAQVSPAPKKESVPVKAMHFGNNFHAVAVEEQPEE